MDWKVERNTQRAAPFAPVWHKSLMWQDFGANWATVRESPPRLNVPRQMLQECCKLLRNAKAAPKDGLLTHCSYWRILVGLTGESSNQLFQALEEWERHLASVDSKSLGCEYDKFAP